MVAKNKQKLRQVIGLAKKGKGWSSWFQALSEVPPFIHILFIFILIITLFLLFIFSGNNNISPLYKEAKKVSEEGKILSLHYNVYGDHYVNDLAVDKNRTDFYYDNITTAFMFTPNYSWIDKAVCQDKYCNLSPLDWHFPASYEKEYCLNEECLRLSDNNIFFNDVPISYPSAVLNKEIRSINIYPLEDVWLIGFVFQDNNLEKGLAYQFTGNEFINLDPDNNFPFVSRENFKGATFGFGGDKDNFLVIYGGYDFLGYQVLENKKVDISRFLGLRVSGGGFSPIAYRIEKEEETIWYLCSLDENKPRLIKMWQNSSDSIKGSLALTKVLLEDREDATSAWCRLDSNNNLEVLISRGNSYYTKVLEDKGFRQKESYTLVSKNLLSSQGEMNKAVFSNLLACDDKGCDNKTINNSLAFSVSGNGQDFLTAKLDQEVKFPENSPGMYYSLKAKGKSNVKHYSPWIDGLTAISYSWWE